LFEAANGGTIFLDEVGSTPLSIQGKLLRVLQEKEVRRVGSNENIPVDSRVLAATNSDLRTLIDQGTFREDLYYRLSVIPIEIKPLRERREDILPIAYQVLQQEVGPDRELPVIEPDVREVLENYGWPGNVRELQNALKHALMFAQENKIALDALPPKIVNSARASGGGTLGVSGAGEGYRGKSLKTFLRAKENEYLKQVLSYVDGDKEKAAKALKISLATLYRKLGTEEGM
ncbi:MAG: sigma 54-interacting transcriptional regulator, partial [Kiritimatiellae bacterium]|nr:sigma 54-interacting transcriptional regulator [Kiritimatiellia bacterium]